MLISTDSMSFLAAVLVNLKADNERKVKALKTQNEINSTLGSAIFKGFGVPESMSSEFTQKMNAELEEAISDVNDVERTRDDLVKNLEGFSRIFGIIEGSYHRYCNYMNAKKWSEEEKAAAIELNTYLKENNDIMSLPSVRCSIDIEGYMKEFETANAKA